MRLAILFSIAAALLAQTPSRMKIAVERSEKGVWRAVDPKLVFDSGDRVRFKFTAGFSGFLYVMNQSTSGKYENLFPREDTGSANRIEAGREYVIPATEGWFRISGPPGHDILYWVVSPVEMEGSRPAYTPLPPPPPAEAPKSFRPRCDDTIFKSRGDCVDSSAGAKAIGAGAKLPSNLAPLEGAKSRELLFIQNNKGTTVSSAEPLNGPVIYEFRLAHK
jgi:hypothetical protein